MATKDSSPLNINRMLDVAYILAFTALISGLAFVVIPVRAGGFTVGLENAAIILTGLVLGSRRGLLSVAVFLGLGMFIFPTALFSCSDCVGSPLDILFTPAAGLFAGYLVSVVLAGLIAYSAPQNAEKSLLILLILGGLVALGSQYLLIGIGFAFRGGFPLSEMLYSPIMLTIIIADLVKLVAVVAIALGVHATLPDLRNRHPLGLSLGSGHQIKTD